MVCQRCGKQSVSGIRKVSLKSNGYEGRLCIGCVVLLLDCMAEKMTFESFLVVLGENKYPTTLKMR